VKRGWETSSYRARQLDERRMILALFSHPQWQIRRWRRRFLLRFPRMMTLMNDPIYLDHNATTPVLPEVVEAMRACYAEPYMNPASQHEFGRRARRKLEDARDRIAELLGAKTTGTDADRVIFTSGGTEANNLAIRGLLQRAGVRAPSRTDGRPPNLHPHLVISSLEHPSIYSLAEELSRNGVHVVRVPATCDGVTQAAELSALLRPETRLVSVMLGQNETGVLQPVTELAAICGDIPLHTDAAQVVGKLTVSFRALGAATMTIAAHKFHGPLGVGALVVHHGTDLQPQLFGGFQQGGSRPGTESVALAVGMCRALESWQAERVARAARMRDLRDHFERQILTFWPTAVIIGNRAERLPHVSNVAFVGLDRQALFLALDQAGVACSTGSACASGSSEPSPALIAMGLHRAEIESSLRFSLGATTTAAEIDEAARRIFSCCNDLRRRKHG
jgi:cysteine desulfurase